MKKIVMLALMAGMTLPVMAKGSHHQQYKMADYTIPAGSMTVAQIAKNIEKKGYQIYSVRVNPKSNSYFVMVKDKDNKFWHQSYDLKTGKLLNEVDREKMREERQKLRQDRMQNRK